MKRAESEKPILQLRIDYHGCNNGDIVKPGTRLVEWDPYSAPILTEAVVIVHFGDLVEGVTMAEQVDEGSGLSHKVVVEGRDPNARPRITIKDAQGVVVIGCSERALLATCCRLVRLSWLMMVK